MSEEMLAVFIGSSIRLAMPLALAATGELVSERAGVLNMSVEGMMLMGAFGGAIGAWATGSPVLGLAIGVLAALPVALLQAWLSITLRANQIVTGIGFLGAGVMFSRQGIVTGVTTAAVIWMLAAIGAAIGIGYFTGAVVLSVVVVAILVGVELLESSVKWLTRGVHRREED